MAIENPESHVLARFDAPAFVRRARDLNEAWQAIVSGCRIRYDEYLLIPKLRLARLVALAGDHTRIRDLLEPPASVDELMRLFEAWRPRLRVAIDVTPSATLLRAALEQLLVSFDRFNHRWSRFVEQVPLTRLNELREAYNRFYLLEKECAMRSPAVARDRFQPLAPVLASDLMALYPLLPALRLRS